MNSGAFAAAAMLTLGALAPVPDAALAQATGASRHHNAGTPPTLEGTYGGFVPRDAPVPLPAMSFQDEHGGTVSMEQFRGKLVLLNLWGTWCPPCVAEMPSLDRLQRHFDRERFEVVAVCFECGGVDLIRKFFKEHRLEHLGIYHRQGFEMTRTLRVKGMPTSILIDDAGHDLGRLAGDADWSSEPAIALIRYYLDGPK